MFTTLIDSATLADHLADPDWVVVDCRFDLARPGAGREAYALGHVPGARYAHLDEDLSGPLTHDSGRHPLPEPGRLTVTLRQWGIGKATQVVCYDDCGGMYAARLWWMLRWLGHGAVALLDGGLPAWIDAGHGLQAGAEAPSAPGDFEPMLRADCWLSTDAVAQGSLDLWDAREPARYRGEVEPIDPVAGHIPGARNVPCSENLGADGRFLPAPALRQRFDAVLAGEAPGQVVHLCGSGVTACHNLLAMEIAGLGGSRLYPGSWSAWISDPARPVATGPG